MKAKAILLLCSVVLLQTILHAQALRYFQFNTTCFTNGNNTWQDSSFIAATSDSILIDSIYADLSRPVSVRRMIVGPINSGNGGYNHNASHWFLWHFIENQWVLSDAAVEVCDACPTGVDLCVSCFINIHSYCPWSSYVVKEISASAIKDFTNQFTDYKVVPNPVKEDFKIRTNNPQPFSITIYDLTLHVVLQKEITTHSVINLSQLSEGLYFYTLYNKERLLAKGKLIKQ